MDKTINTEDYREDIIKELETRNLPADTVEFKDIADEAAPYQVTRCFKIRKKIILKKKITPEEKGAILIALAEKFPEDVKLLEDDRNFVLQRVICEAYHIIYRYQVDYECNKLAIYDVKKGSEAFYGRGETRH
ncbi:MAG: hypothetical protein BMS9Abin24_028 [Thermodesulfobacteriota bacterium]|nr:MAG: hypothetical protein BMS9Abin24_028 [Thermodesulfobacteriota bacterium]